MKKSIRKTAKKVPTQEPQAAPPAAAQAVSPLPTAAAVSLVAAAARTGPAKEKIAARARDLWQAEGCPSGRDVEHWLKAEAELRAECSAA